MPVDRHRAILLALESVLLLTQQPIFCDQQKTKQTKRNEKLKALFVSLSLCVCECLIRYI